MTALEGAKLGAADVGAPAPPAHAPGVEQVPGGGRPPGVEQVPGGGRPPGIERAPGDGRLPGDTRGPADRSEQPPQRQAEPVADWRPLTLRAVGLGLTLLGVFLLGFVGYLYGLSDVQEARSQATLYTQLRTELANAVAPVGPTTPGAPVAILNIPSIGVHDMVVVEGTSAQNMTLGPGHLRNTPLPGQGGVSEIYGRRATFGAPFSRLAQLRPGDKIIAITGQGRSIYVVTALGSSHRVVRNPATNQLLLLTAASSTVPSYYIYADADLTSAAQPSPGDLPDISIQETALSSDTDALTMAMLWALALALVSGCASVAAMRWSPWLAYLAAAPVVLAVLWNLYQSLAVLLPNVY